MEENSLHNQHNIVNFLQSASSRAGKQEKASLDRLPMGDEADEGFEYGDKALHARDAYLAMVKGPGDYSGSGQRNLTRSASCPLTSAILVDLFKKHVPLI